MRTANENNANQEQKALVPMVIITESYAIELFSSVKKLIDEKVQIVNNMVIEDETDIGKAADIIKDLKNLGKRVKEVFDLEKAPYKDSLDNLTAANKELTGIIDVTARTANDKVLAKQKQIESDKAKKQAEEEAKENAKVNEIKALTEKLQKEADTIMESIIKATSTDQLIAAANIIKDLKADTTYQPIDGLRNNLVTNLRTIGKEKNETLKSGNVAKQKEIEKNVEEHKKAIGEQAAKTITAAIQESNKALTSLEKSNEITKKLATRKQWDCELVNEKELAPFFMSFDKERAMTWLKNIANASADPTEHIVPEVENGVIYRGVRFFKKEIVVNK